MCLFWPAHYDTPTWSCKECVAKPTLEYGAPCHPCFLCKVVEEPAYVPWRVWGRVGSSSAPELTLPLAAISTLPIATPETGLSLPPTLPSPHELVRKALAEARIIPGKGAVWEATKLLEECSLSSADDAPVDLTSGRAQSFSKERRPQSGTLGVNVIDNVVPHPSSLTLQDDVSPQLPIASLPSDSTSTPAPSPTSPDLAGSSKVSQAEATKLFVPPLVAGAPSALVGLPFPGTQKCAHPRCGKYFHYSCLRRLCDATVCAAIVSRARVCGAPLPIFIPDSTAWSAEEEEAAKILGTYPQALPYPAPLGTSLYPPTPPLPPSIAQLAWDPEAEVRTMGDVEPLWAAPGCTGVFFCPRHFCDTCEWEKNAGPRLFMESKLSYTSSELTRISASLGGGENLHASMAVTLFLSLLQAASESTSPLSGGRVANKRGPRGPPSSHISSSKIIDQQPRRDLESAWLLAPWELAPMASLPWKASNQPSLKLCLLPIPQSVLSDKEVLVGNKRVFSEEECGEFWEVLSGEGKGEWRRALDSVAAARAAPPNYDEKSNQQHLNLGSEDVLGSIKSTTEGATPTIEAAVEVSTGNEMEVGENREETVADAMSSTVEASLPASLADSTAPSAFQQLENSRLSATSSHTAPGLETGTLRRSAREKKPVPRDLDEEDHLSGSTMDNSGIGISSDKQVVSSRLKGAPTAVVLDPSLQPSSPAHAFASWAGSRVGESTTSTFAQVEKKQQRPQKLLLAPAFHSFFKSPSSHGPKGICFPCNILSSPHPPSSGSVPNPPLSAADAMALALLRGPSLSQSLLKSLPSIPHRDFMIVASDRRDMVRKLLAPPRGCRPADRAPPCWQCTRYYHTDPPIKSGSKGCHPTQCHFLSGGEVFACPVHAHIRVPGDDEDDEGRYDGEDGTDSESDGKLADNCVGEGGEEEWNEAQPSTALTLVKKQKLSKVALASSSSACSVVSRLLSGAPELAHPFFMGDPRHYRIAIQDIELVEKWKEESEPYLPFKKISVNKYPPGHRAPPLGELEECSCRKNCEKEGKPPTCGEDCVNALLFTECLGGPGMVAGLESGASEEGAGVGGASAVPTSKTSKASNCSVGVNCGNRRVSLRQGPSDMLVTRTGSKGWGLKAGPRGIKTGDFIIEYVGEIITEEEQNLRLTEAQSRGESHAYIMEITSDEIIDARYFSNNARFINHSCDPNASLERWLVRGYTRIGIFAIKDIAPGEEVTYDYQFWTAEETPCGCGTAKCRGFLGANVAQDKAREKAEAEWEKRENRKRGRPPGGGGRKKSKVLPLSSDTSLDPGGLPNDLVAAPSDMTNEELGATSFEPATVAAPQTVVDI